MIEIKIDGKNVRCTVSPHGADELQQDLVQVLLAMRQTIEYYANCAVANLTMEHLYDAAFGGKLGETITECDEVQHGD